MWNGLGAEEAAYTRLDVDDRADLTAREFETRRLESSARSRGLELRSLQATTATAIEPSERASIRSARIALGKSAKIAKGISMPFRPLRISLCFLTWVCVVVLAIPSLLPAQPCCGPVFRGCSSLFGNRVC